VRELCRLGYVRYELCEVLKARILARSP
jgi:hypothetical protein